MRLALWRAVDAVVRPFGFAVAVRREVIREAVEGGWVTRTTGRTLFKVRRWKLAEPSPTRPASMGEWLARNAR